MISLSDSVQVLKGISEKTADKLGLLNISSVKDLLTYFPREYIDSSQITAISDLHAEHNDHFTIEAYVTNTKNIRLKGRRTLQRAELSDGTGKINAMWFNQPYVLNTFNKPNQMYLLRGKVRKKGNSLNFYPVNVDSNSDKTKHLGGIIPEYALTKGIGKKWFRNRIYSLCNDYLLKGQIKIPEANYIPNIETLIYELHFPQESETFDRSKRSLSILELASIQYKLYKKDLNIIKGKESKFDIFPETINKLSLFIEKLPFELTADQRGTIDSIISQLRDGSVLNELIQGDVGTGKTIVALALCYVFALQKKQCVILAPTTVLAEQHYKNAKELFPEDITIDLVTASTDSDAPSDILIGTTAVLARKLNIIENLGLVIVDEQHRFGVRQREELLKPLSKDKDKTVHYLNMTATPIPRTIAQTFLGSTGVHTIKTKPKGRKEIKTFIVPYKKRKDGYEWIRGQLTVENAQVYWIFPLIEDSDAIDAKSLLTESENLKKEFNEHSVAILHGRMKNEEKLQIMKDFKAGKIDILLSTTVIEVGVDNPNATIMVIENPERFGLAQLHQIRGRVGRGDKRSFCFLNLDKKNNVDERLEFFAKENDGLKIAEYDLARRGPGEVYGIKQSGIPELKVADLLNEQDLANSKKLLSKIIDKNLKLELFI